MSSYDDDDCDDGDDVELTNHGTRGKSRACHTGAKMRHSDANHLKQAAVNWGFCWTVMTLIAFLVLSVILAQERTSGHFTTHYWLNGNDDIDGDTFRSQNVSLVASCVVSVVLLISTIMLGWRTFNKLARADLRNGEGKWALGRKSAMARNHAVYEPIAVADALAFVMAAQEGGLANLWVMIIGAALSLAGDVLLPLLRLEVRSEKLKGSSGVAMLSYLLCKLMPFTLVIVSVAKYVPMTKVTAAIATYYAIMGLRVVLSFWMFMWPSLVYMFGGEAYDDGCARWVVERSDSDPDTGHRNSQAKEISEYTNDPKNTKKWRRNVFWVQIIGAFVCLVLFWITLSGTQWTLGDSDSGGRHVFARITMTTTTGPSGEIVTQFDRTYPLGQFAIPMQFALMMLLFFVLLFWRCWPGLRSTLGHYWQRGRDPFAEFAFGVADFFVVWTLLTITGTTEVAELIINGACILGSRMIWSETRKNSSFYFSLLAFLTGMLPFVQAAVNISLVTVRSNQQLWAVIVLFILYGVRDLVLYVILNHVETHVTVDGVDLRAKLRVLKPHHVVISRSIGNVIIRIVSMCVLYYTHALYDGWQIVNDK